MAKTIKPELMQLETYPFHINIQTRFSDLDTLRHVNNVAVANLYEESRVQFNREAFREFRKNATDEMFSRRVIADVHIQYLREVHFPHPVTIGVGISHIGNTSYTMASVMFQEGQCVGLCDAVLVFTDVDKSQGMPPNARDILERYRI